MGLNNKCPVCFSENDIGSELVEITDGYASQQCNCINCGSEWEDTYILFKQVVTFRPKEQ